MIKSWHLIIILSIVCSGCNKKEMTLSDVQSKEDLVEYNKTEQAKNEIQEGQRLVQDFTATFPDKSPEQLIRMFVTHPEFGFVTAAPPRYILMRDGNMAIIQELKRRGLDAIPVLRKNVDNWTVLFSDHAAILKPGSLS